MGSDPDTNSAGTDDNEHRAIAERSARGVLAGVRRIISNIGLETSDFPDWLSGAAIHIARLENEADGTGTILWFTASGTGDGKDIVADYRTVTSDLGFLYPDQEEQPVDAIISIGPNDEGAGLVDNSEFIVNPTCALTNLGMRDVPQCLLVFNVATEYEYPPHNKLAVQHIPFAVFVSDDLLEFETLWAVSQD